ncbi:MAG: cytochrome b [Hyphomonadaceae bacterium]|nr:cytochrome b [Hyphomonadaceae bacterium]MBC6411642.1 cytochrome b [Hyphomonadaceae bacterium]
MFAAEQQYTRVAIWLHWVVAVLIVGQIIGGKIMTAMAGSPTKYEIFQLHKSFGVVILLLSLVRLGWRFTHKPPALPDGMKTYERLGARLTHVGFYVLMIVVPLSGWIVVSVSTPKISTELFKIIPWPDVPFLTRTDGAEVLWKNVHNCLAITVALTFFLHVGAALKHHFVNKDDVLTRMIPILKPGA